MPQVKQYLTWIQWLVYCKVVTEDTIWINIDETPMSRIMKSRAGYMAKGVPKQRASPRCEHKVSSGHLKQQCSLMGAICSDPALQQHLPQVFMPRTLGAQKDWMCFPKEHHHPSLRIILGGTGWTTSEIWKIYLDELLTEVQHHVPLNRIALVWDAYDAHLGVPIIKSLIAKNIPIVVVPGGMTWLLQVLDTRVFADVKRFLANRLAQARAHSATGNIDVTTWIEVAFETVTKTLIHAQPQNHFPQHGCSTSLNSLSWRLQDFAHGVTGKHCVPMTESQLQVYVGRKKAGLWHAIMPIKWRLKAHERIRYKVGEGPITRSASRRSLA